MKKMNIDRNLMQEASFYFKLKFSAEKLKKLR